MFSFHVHWFRLGLIRLSDLLFVQLKAEAAYRMRCGGFCRVLFIIERHLIECDLRAKHAFNWESSRKTGEMGVFEEFAAC